jgi:hypothetical protein
VVQSSLVDGYQSFGETSPPLPSSGQWVGWSLLHCRWRRWVPPKRWHPSTKSHCITLQRLKTGEVKYLFKVAFVQITIYIKHIYTCDHLKKRQLSRILKHLKINIWRIQHLWRWSSRPKHVVKDSGNQHTIKLYADGDIACNTHWTIQCSRMLKYSTMHKML